MKFAWSEATKITAHATSSGRPSRWSGTSRAATPGLRGLDAITTRKHPAQGRTVKAFNPVARPDYQLFVALMSGEHAVHGFANRDLRAKLPGHLREDPKQQSA